MGGRAIDTPNCGSANDSPLNMIILPNRYRLFLTVGACALTFSVAACTDNNLSPDNIPPNASTGPGNAFSPGSGGGSGAIGGGADTGFPSNGGGNGANAPGH
jgi:hypothetical protein